MIRHQRGDTIIEVLLSIAVLGVIIVGAYVTANHATVTLRDAQEHEEALNLAQDQVEDLRSYVANNSTVDSDIVCFKDGTTPISGAIDNEASPPAGAATNSCLVDNLGQGPVADSPDQCTADFTGASYCYEVNLFQSSYTAGSSPTSLSQFEVRVVWDSLLDPGQIDQATLFYRPQ